MKFNELFKLLKTSLSKIDNNLEPEIVSSYFMRIYYTEKPVLDIKYIKDKDTYVLEDYLGNTTTSDNDSIKSDIEEILSNLNFIQESLFLEESKKINKGCQLIKFRV